MSRPSVLVACLAGAVLAGCGPFPAGDEDGTVEVLRPAAPEGVFLMAEIRVREGSIPERFTRELPARAADLEAQAADYPLVHLRKKLCAGDVEALGRFSGAVTAAAAAGDDLDALRRSYGTLLEWCGRPELCAWATAAVAGEGAVAELAWEALPLCPGDEVVALFERPGAPAAAVAEYRTIRSWFDDSSAPVAPPEDEVLEEKLRTLGLSPRGPLPGTENWLDGASGTVAILTRSGPVHCFDVETDQYPNEHDALLYDLAELAGPPLDRAVFEEEPPPLETGGAPDEPYRLRAYLDGRVYETDARNYGDWYDLEQVLGLLNAMAAHQGAAARLEALTADGQTACVLAAPGDAILAGIREGLLEASDAAEAMAAGKTFEDEVMKKLREAISD